LTDPIHLIFDLITSGKAICLATTSNALYSIALMSSSYSTVFWLSLYCNILSRKRLEAILSIITLRMLQYIEGFLKN